MWEFLVALFGGASIMTKYASDKSKLACSQEEFEYEQRKLEVFRRFVSNPNTVKQVEDMMNSAGHAITQELAEVFRGIPELRGFEKDWSLRCYDERFSKWNFVRFILCVNRGCIPIVDQMTMSIRGYYTADGTYVAFSDSSCHRIARWATETIRRTCPQLNGDKRFFLSYENDESYYQRFKWCVNIEESRSMDARTVSNAKAQRKWDRKVKDLAFEEKSRATHGSVEFEEQCSFALGLVRSFSGMECAEFDFENRLHKNAKIFAEEFIHYVHMVNHGKLPSAFIPALFDYCDRCLSIPYTNEAKDEFANWAESALQSHGIKNARLHNIDGDYLWEPYVK